MAGNATALAEHTRDQEQVERIARLRWVPVALMEVSPLAQREFKQYRVDHLVANFDPEQLGTPTVNHRQGRYFIIDGQHRIATVKAVGWGDQSIQCWTYDNLTEAEEASMFLKLNDTLAVRSFDKFRIGVRAGRHPEVDVDHIIRSVGLRVAAKGVGAVRAPATLVNIYNAHGGQVLTAALSVVHEAFGDAGLQSRIVAGVSLMLSRYSDGLVDLARLVTQLGEVHLGADGLIQAAWKLREKSGTSFTIALAAATVDVYNQGLAGPSRKRLASWWRSGGDDSNT